MCYVSLPNTSFSQSCEKLSTQTDWGIVRKHYGNVPKSSKRRPIK
jgi:hypothetical protein